MIRLKLRSIVYGICGEKFFPEFLEKDFFSRIQ